MDANRASLEMFQAAAPAPAQVEAVPVSYEDMEVMCDQLGIPKAMRDRCVAAAARFVSAWGAGRVCATRNITKAMHNRCMPATGLF